MCVFHCSRTVKRFFSCVFFCLFRAYAIRAFSFYVRMNCSFRVPRIHILGDGDANIERFQFLRKLFATLCSIFDTHVHNVYGSALQRVCVWCTKLTFICHTKSESVTLNMHLVTYSGFIVNISIGGITITQLAPNFIVFLLLLFNNSCTNDTLIRIRCYCYFCKALYYSWHFEQIPLSNSHQIVIADSPSALFKCNQ